MVANPGGFRTSEVVGNAVPPVIDWTFDDDITGNRNEFKNVVLEDSNILHLASFPSG